MKNQLLSFFSLVILLSLLSCNMSKKSTESNGEPFTLEEENTERTAEELTVWIGPKRVEARCGSPMAPPSCREMRHQSQVGELDKNGTWEPFYDFFQLPDYEEGYIYQVQYIKERFSEAELRMIADHPGYEVKDIVILSKEKF